MHVNANGHIDEDIYVIKDDGEGQGRSQDEIRGLDTNNIFDMVVGAPPRSRSSPNG